MSSSSSWVLGNYFADSLALIGTGTFTCFHPYILNLRNIVSTYFLWFNQNFLSSWFLSISIPNSKLVALASFMLNLEDNFIFTSLITSMVSYQHVIDIQHYIDNNVHQPACNKHSDHPCFLKILVPVYMCRTFGTPRRLL